MTPLENQTLSGGFKLCLLGTRTDRPSAQVEYCATLFKNGTRTYAVHHVVDRRAPSDDAIADLRVAPLLGSRLR